MIEVGLFVFPALSQYQNFIIMKTLIKFFPILLLAFTSCAVPQMMLNQELEQNAAAWDVKGKQGWVFNQKISFGPYATGKVYRGWTKSYDVPFFVRFRGSKEKFHFEQKGPEGSLMVHTVQSLKAKEIDFLKGYFSIPLDFKDAFSGTIGTEKDPAKWTFVVNNPNDQYFGETSEGYLSNGNELYKIHEVRQNSKKRDTKWGLIFGYEVFRNGKVIAGIETINNGRVWIDKNLNEEETQVLAAFAAALLLRSELDLDSKN